MRGWSYGNDEEVSPEEVRERAVRMVFEQQAEHGSQWAAIKSIAGEDRVHGGDAAQLGAAGGARPRERAGDEQLGT